MATKEQPRKELKVVQSGSVQIKFTRVDPEHVDEREINGIARLLRSFSGDHAGTSADEAETGLRYIINGSKAVYLATTGRAILGFGTLEMPTPNAALLPMATVSREFSGVEGGIDDHLMRVRMVDALLNGATIVTVSPGSNPVMAITMNTLNLLKSSGRIIGYRESVEGPIREDSPSYVTFEITSVPPKVLRFMSEAQAAREHGTPAGFNQSAGLLNKAANEVETQLGETGSEMASQLRQRARDDSVCALDVQRASSQERRNGRDNRWMPNRF